jgi:carbonic anhydrase
MVLCASTLENSWLPPNDLIGSTSPRVDRGPGDRFAGNSITPNGLPSLEFGAAVLPTKLIIVLGHNSCGAVNATVTALQKGDTLAVHIAHLVRAMKPGIEPVSKQSGDDLQQRAVVANMRYNAQRLQRAKPILAENDSQE